MPQTVACPHCTQQLSIADEMAGKALRCPRCQKPFSVQAPAAAPPRQPMPGPAAFPGSSAGRPAVAPAPTPNAAARRCPTCKADLPPGARACMECGYFFPAPGSGNGPVAAAPPVAPAPQTYAPPQTLAYSAPPVHVPAAPPAPPPPPAPTGPVPWARLAPVAVLVLALAGIVGRDLTLESATGGDDKEKTAKSTFVEPPIDPEPLLALGFWADSGQFGITTVKVKDEHNQPKRLTFDEKGDSNFTFVRIDGRTYDFGKFSMTTKIIYKKDDKLVTKGNAAATKEYVPGEWEVKDQDLGEDTTKRKREGKRFVYFWDKYKVYVSQEVEIVPGQVENGKKRLDTCLVKYQLENRGQQPRKVGLRFLLDTYIGANDGVAFTIPGQSERCDTFKDMVGPAVPDFLQALEYNEPGKSGTVAHLSVKYGGALEAPSRVVLTRYRRPLLEKKDGEWLGMPWDMALEDMKKGDENNPKPDSAVALYWEERELKPGDKRLVGFAYGLGHVSSTEGSRLELTTAVNLHTGVPFAITAYVSNPVRDQVVSLELPPDLELVEGQASQAVPPLAAGAASGRSPVTWKVKAAKPGPYTLKAKSITGEAEATIFVNKDDIY